MVISNMCEVFATGQARLVFSHFIFKPSLGRREDSVLLSWKLKCYRLRLNNTPKITELGSDGGWVGCVVDF